VPARAIARRVATRPGNRLVRVARVLESLAASGYKGHMGEKLRWILGLAVVFLLVLLSGRSNVNNYKRVQAAIETIYADRLVVKDIIYELRSLLYAKELALVTEDWNHFAAENFEGDTRAQELLEQFRATYLVPAEEKALERFVGELAGLTELEQQLGLAAGRPIDEEELAALVVRLDRLEGDLDLLSRIQLDEGRRQLMLGDKAIEEMDLLANIESYLLATGGVLAILVLLFIPRRKAGHQ